MLGFELDAVLLARIQFAMKKRKQPITELRSPVERVGF